MKNFSKRMTTLLSKVEERSYSPIEAIKLVKENANAKFDETIEAHIRLGIDPKYTDQQLRTTVALPSGADLPAIVQAQLGMSWLEALLPWPSREPCTSVATAKLS